MSLRRMLPFIFINIVVSAVVVLVILSWWDSRQADSVLAATPFVDEEFSPIAGAPTSASSNAAETEEESPRPSGDEGDDEEGPTIHIVQAGDTLGLISERYDVPLVDIAEANGIVNINSISVGQELVIPIDGLPTPTVAPAASEATPDEPPTPLSCGAQACF